MVRGWFLKITYRVRPSDPVRTYRKGVETLDDCLAFLDGVRGVNAEVYEVRFEPLH